MSSPPFSGPTLRIEPPPRNRLPLIAGMVGSLAIAYVLAILWRITTPDPLPPSPKSVNAAYPAQVTVLVIATVTPTPTPAPTQTPYVVYRAATRTPTVAYLLCDAAADNTVCVRLAPSATATPPPPPCRFLTPVEYNPQVCVKGDGSTSANQEDR